MMNVSLQNKSKVLKRKIYDPLQIVLHWGISGSCLGLLVTGFLFDSKEWGPERSHLVFWHTKLGYLLLFFLTGRFLWAFIGPRYARWSDIFNRIKSAKHHPQYGTLDRPFGHDPKASRTYLFVWLILVINIATGLFWNAIDHNRGILAIWFFDQINYLQSLSLVHSIGSWLTIIFLFIHLGALTWHQIQNQYPMFQAMFTGHQFRRLYDK